MTVDIFAWSQSQAEAIRERRWSDVDIDAVAEEIEEMGKRDRRALEGFLAVRLLHLLKWRYQYNRHCRSWRQSLAHAAVSARRLLKDNPSLRAQLPELISEAYTDARDIARAEAGLSAPVHCEWDEEEILNLDFLPKPFSGSARASDEQIQKS